MMPRAGLVLADRYALRSRIAVGGMGEVWRAEDRATGGDVAAKVLRAELAGQEAFLARLRAEARNAARVRHPNVAVLLDSGEQEGSGFLVLELVDGEPLSAILARRGRLGAAEVVGILAQAARGLGAAHAVGVVHRDVKPANVLLTPDARVKLTDFGISRAVDQASLTAAGRVMGTAQYLSPEQAQGRPASAASDLYALGVVAYEALAGRRPFTGGSQVDIALRHVEDPVPTLPDDVPAPVRAAVARLLAKDPAGRPASGEALARELEALGTASAPAGRRLADAGVPAATAPADVPDGRSAPGVGTLTLPTGHRPAVAPRPAPARPDRTTARNS